VARLSEKLGGKEEWLRSLYLRASIIWVFREELINLELGQSPWLDSILREAYLVAGLQAHRFADTSDAFGASMRIVRNTIEQRMELSGPDPELSRLLELTSNARPCDAIRKIFDKLSRDARNLYREGPRRRIQFDRERLSNHPRGPAAHGSFPDRYHLDAQTAVRGPRSLIELQVHLAGFDAPGLLAIPALLTHELVCHAYADEDCNDLQSIWAEGVMDWAAHFYFTQWSVLLDMPYALVKSHGESLWEQRMSRARTTGRFIADALVQWLASETSVRSLAVAEKVTARFAVEVNVAAAPLLSKDALAARIANIRTDPPLQQDFRDWRAHRRSAGEMILR
jgi:hypothetical protein